MSKFYLYSFPVFKFKSEAPTSQGAIPTEAQISQGALPSEAATSQGALPSDALTSKVSHHPEALTSHEAEDTDTGDAGKLLKDASHSSHPSAGWLNLTDPSEQLPSVGKPATITTVDPMQPLTRPLTCNLCHLYKEDHIKSDHDFPCKVNHVSKCHSDRMMASDNDVSVIHYMVQQGEPSPGTLLPESMTTSDALSCESTQEARASEAVAATEAKSLEALISKPVLPSEALESPGAMYSSLITTQSSLPSETVASPRSLSLDAQTLREVAPFGDENLPKVVVSEGPVPPYAPLVTDALGADILTMQEALPLGALEALSSKDALPLEALTPLATKVLSSQGALASETLATLGTLPFEAPGSPTLLPFDILDVISAELESAGNDEPALFLDNPVTSNSETFASESPFIRANIDQEPLVEKGGSFEFVAAGQPVAASSQSLPVVPMELVAASSAVSVPEADADPLLLDQTDATSKDEQIVSNESPLLVPSNVEVKMCPKGATLCAVKDTGDKEETEVISKIQKKIVEEGETVVGVPSEVETIADVDVTSRGQALQQADREVDIQSPDAVSDQKQQLVSAEEPPAGVLAEKDNAFASVASSSNCQHEASTSSLGSGTKSSSTLEEEDGTTCEPSTSFSSLQKTSSAQGGSHCAKSVTDASDLTEKASAGQEHSYSCTFPNVLKQLSHVAWIKRDPCFRLVGSRQCKYEKGARICVDLYIPLDLVDTLPGKVGSNQFPSWIPDPHHRI
jgi:hypothetical protein